MKGINTCLADITMCHNVTLPDLKRRGSLVESKIVDCQKLFLYDYILKKFYLFNCHNKADKFYSINHCTF